jgi:hypothetical protein
MAPVVQHPGDQADRNAGAGPLIGGDVAENPDGGRWQLHTGIYL